jgi:hypothetical protein
MLLDSLLLQLYLYTPIAMYMSYSLPTTASESAQCRVASESRFASFIPGRARDSESFKVPPLFSRSSRIAFLLTYNCASGMVMHEMTIQQMRMPKFMPTVIYEYGSQIRHERQTLVASAEDDGAYSSANVVEWHGITIAIYGGQDFEWVIRNRDVADDPQNEEERDELWREDGDQGFDCQSADSKDECNA